MLSFYLALIDDPADYELFIDFFQHYEKQMLFISEEILKDEHLAEDAVQESLTRIAKNVKTLKGLNEKQTRKYALTAAKNAALDIIKKRNKLDVVPIETTFNLKDEKMSGEIESRENHSYAVSVLNKLPQKYRDAMYFRYVLDMPEKEIAEILGIKINTVRQHIYRGKEMFAELYNKESDNNEA